MHSADAGSQPTGWKGIPCLGTLSVHRGYNCGIDTVQKTQQKHFCWNYFNL
jgi:hypothetical protein